MIKITSPYSPSNDEAAGFPATLSVDSWKTFSSSNIGKTYYQNLIAYLLSVQSGKCCYCGNKLNVTSAQKVDHIAPKSKHPEYTFYPTNLALSCDKCNGPGHKHVWDTISIKNTSYEEHVFLIVHPYFDDPQDHYGFVSTGSEILIQHKSDKGKITIEKLKLDSVERTQERFHQKIVEVYLNNPEAKKLFDDAINFNKCNPQ